MANAVRWRMLDRTVQTVKERNQDIPAEYLESLINTAICDVRKECPESSNEKSSFQQFAGLLKHSKTFAGDPSELQRKLRDE